MCEMRSIGIFERWIRRDRIAIRGPGEIAVNTANMQIAVGDADITTEGVPLQLIAVRYWNSRSQYDTGEFVVMGGDAYQSLEPIAARTGFDPAQWRNVLGGTGGSCCADRRQTLWRVRITASFMSGSKPSIALATVCLGIFYFKMFLLQLILYLPCLKSGLKEFQSRFLLLVNLCLQRLSLSL